MLDPAAFVGGSFARLMHDSLEPMSPTKNALHPVERFARWSVATGFAVLALKYVAWRLTSSVALLSDALESIVNVVAAVAMALAVRIAHRPEDRNHPYGHGKAEYLSAVLEGVLIVVAAVLTVRAAWGRLLHPIALPTVGVALMVSTVASALNAALSWSLLRAGKRHRSPALTADGRHVLADVVTTAGVLAGVALAWATGRWWLDPLLACGVALNILWMGWKLVRHSVGGLMDEVLDEEEVARGRAIAERVAKDAGALAVEGFRLRRAGPDGHCDLRLKVPGAMSVREAHALCDRIEDALRAWEPGLRVVVHIEPAVVRGGGALTTDDEKR